MKISDIGNLPPRYTRRMSHTNPTQSQVPDRKRETRTILAISLPLMAAYLAEIGMMITDMIIVGRLGSNELAAVGLTADWFYVLLLIGMGVVSIVGVLVAQNYGAGNDEGVRSAVEQGMIVATLCSIPVMLAVWYLGPALQHAGQDPDVIRLIKDYSRPLALSVLPALWFVVLRNFVTALEKAGGIMAITVAALVLNLGLNYTLVYGHFGVPAMGVVGAAIGTTIVTWLMFLVLAVNVKYSAQLERYRPHIIPRSIDLTVCKEILVLGIPITGSQMLGGAMFTVAAIVVGTISAEILAAQMIVYSVLYVGLSMAVAFGDAVRVRVAYGIGKQSVAAARQSSSIAAVLSTIVILGATLILWLVPEQLAGIFLDTSEAANAGVLAIAVSLSVYAGFFHLIDGIMIVFSNALRGLRDTKSPFWILLFGYWVVGLGLGTWLCLVSGYGAAGLWVGLVAGAAVSIVIMILMLRKRFTETEQRLALV